MQRWLAKVRTVVLASMVVGVVSVLAWGQDLRRSLFVENSLGRTLSVVDLEGGQVRNDVATLGQVPNQIVAYRDRLYVLNSVPPEIMQVDPLTMSVVEKIGLPEGSNPYDMRLVGARRAYVTLLVANQVAVVDLAERRVVKTIDVGKAPQGLYVDLSSRRAYVANTGGYPDFADCSVSIIDVVTDSVVGTLPVPTNPQFVAMGPDFNVYVVCSGKWGEDQGRLCVINPWAPPNYEPAVVDTIELGGFPGDIVVTPSGKAYIADWGDESGGFLYVVDVFKDSVLHDRTNPLRVGRGAMRLLLDPVTEVLYVSNFDQDTVQRFDTKGDSVTATCHVGDGPQGLAIVGPIEASDPWADEVVEFVPGSPWSKFGYDFFPDNLLGPPTPSAAVGPYTPSNSEDEILSLGDGGQITLKFTDNVVVDGPGPDFTVFENVFINLWTGEPFVEAATVSVSQDGEQWYTFPYDTTDLSGLAGVHPVLCTLCPTNPDSSGGDTFDLADLGLDWIRYVRLTDLGQIWKEGLYNGDFDLDAVVAVNSAPSEPSRVAAAGSGRLPRDFTVSPCYPNPFNPSTALEINLKRREHLRVEVVDAVGRVVRVLEDGTMEAGVHVVQWDGTTDEGGPAASGLYLIRVRSAERSVVRKAALLK